jgi:hypothetical protein
MINPYAPPRDVGDDRERPIPFSRQSAQFYSVSTSKLAVLQVVTFGLYGVYWFYRHWAVQKRSRRLDIWPIARAFFAIFFVHRLFLAIDQGARATGVSTKWKHRSQATLYVTLAIVAGFRGSFGSSVLPFIATLALNAASILPLSAAQRVANLANGRPFLMEDEDDEDENADYE